MQNCYVENFLPLKLNAVSLLGMFSGKIKELLSAELEIPVSKMELHGWIHKNDALIQDTVSFV